MFWMYPEKKYNQSAFSCYNASVPRPFSQKGENGGAFTASKCDWIVSLSQHLAKSPSYTAKDINSSYRQVSVWGVHETKKNKMALAKIN